MTMLALTKTSLLRTSLTQCVMVIFIIQIVSSLSFSVLYSTLILYARNKLLMPASSANNVVGVFLAFNYLLHILGGIWGGKYFSNRLLFCFGMSAQFIGCLLIAVESSQFLYYGLSVFLTGSGLNVTCLNCILTQRFTPEDSRRETIFLWNYSGMSLGFFIGYSLSGVYQLSQDYHGLFLVSSIGNLLAISVCILGWSHLKDINTHYAQMQRKQQIRASLFGFLAIILLPFLLYQTFRFAAWSNMFIIFIGVLMLPLMLIVAKQQHNPEDQNKLKACAVFMLVSAFFWMLYQMGPMGLTVFTEYNVQRHYANWIIPPQWFPNINTFCIIIGGPLLASMFKTMRTKGIEINLPTQFAAALMFVGLAFILLPIGIAFASHEGLVHPIWIIAYYLLQSIGEMLLAPISYAMIGFLVPSTLQGLMMGILMMYCGVGATLANYTSNFIIRDQTSTQALITNTNYSQMFLLLGLTAILCATALRALTPKIRLHFCSQ